MYGTDVFISYKREKQLFASELKSRLEARGHRVWMDTCIPYGRDWRAAIDTQLENALLIVVITEPDSMKSPYVTYEWCYACFALGRDFHWILTDHCDLDDGMFSLLMSKRQKPLEFTNKTPTESDWEKLIDSVEERLRGVKSIREDDQILKNLHISADLQRAAAERLGQVTDPFHKPLAQQFLLQGLKTHTTTTGIVSGSIVSALRQLNMNDLSAIPYLIRFLETKHEDKIDEMAQELLEKLVAQNS